MHGKKQKNPEGSTEDGTKFDDGWEELGISSVKPSATELEILLHQQILVDTCAFSSFL